ncbi:MAG TPA: hypothetical protein VKK79_25935 [Candidatus Lokiarchaeia archaeon]|nr:hypothetical protein [Candidatus Lokiarchaeia archaeon]
MVATRLSRMLRDALKLFAESFCDQYHPCFATSNNVEQFIGATLLGIAGVLPILHGLE